MTATNELDKARQLIANLANSLEQIKAENRYLRRRNEEKHPYHRNTAPRIVRRAYDDARSLIVLRASELPTSRRFVLDSIGMSNRRHAWAMALLRTARIVNHGGFSWAEMDTATAIAKLDAKYDALKTAPDAIERLRLYMAKSFQHAYSGNVNR